MHELSEVEDCTLHKLREQLRAMDANGAESGRVTGDAEAAAAIEVGESTGRGGVNIRSGSSSTSRSYGAPGNNQTGFGRVGGAPPSEAMPGTRGTVLMPVHTPSLGPQSDGEMSAATRELVMAVGYLESLNEMTAKVQTILWCCCCC